MSILVHFSSLIPKMLMFTLAISCLTYRINTKKDILFIIGDWNATVGSQEIPGITGKFGLGVQNEAGQWLTVLPRECTGHRKHPLATTQEDDSTHRHHQMVSTEIRLIIFFATKDEKALYSHSK